MLTFGWSEMTWRQWGRLTADGWGRWPVTLRLGRRVRSTGKVRDRVTIDCVRLSAGDPDEWRRLVASCYDRLVGRALRVVGNVHDADDVVQNLFVRLWLARSGLPRILNLDRYLTVAVRHHALNQVRSKRIDNGHAVLRAEMDYLPCRQVWDPAHRIEAREREEALAHLADLLTPAQLRVYRHIEQDPDASSRAIAGKASCSHRNVLAVLRRIRGVLAAQGGAGADMVDA